MDSNLNCLTLPVLARCGPEQKSVYSDTWKLIAGPPIAPRLFDLARDPGETNNVAQEHPERLRDLQRLIDAHLESSAKLSSDTPAPVRREEQEKELVSLSPMICRRGKDGLPEILHRP